MICDPPGAHGKTPPLQCLQSIPGLAHALFPVFNGLCGAVADAGHAVGTVSAPDGLAASKNDIIGGAELRASAAAGAGGSGRKSPVLHHQGVKDRIHRPADHPGRCSSGRLENGTD